MTSTRYPQSRTDGILTQKLADEVLVYDLDREKVLCLNESTALVWLQCDGTRSVAEITRALSVQTGKTVSEDIVWMALRQLASENLLAIGESFETPFDGMTRRDMVRRVGLATMAAPFIFEVMAPSAAHAGSVTCGPIGNCTAGQTTVCLCVPISLPGSNSNPNDCPCATQGDCALEGICQCSNPCTPGVCPAGESCQSGLCSGSGTPCNGSCPAGTTCVDTPGDSAFGTCSGTCPPGNNVCADGVQGTPCIPGDTSNLNPDCCPCSNAEGCANCCNDGTCGPCVG